MNIICKGIFDADQSVDDPKAKKFATFAQNFEPYLKDSKKCKADEIEKDSLKAKKELNVNKLMFENIMKSDPDVEDMQFGK